MKTNCPFIYWHRVGAVAGIIAIAATIAAAQDNKSGRDSRGKGAGSAPRSAPLQPDPQQLRTLEENLPPKPKPPEKTAAQIAAIQKAIVGTWRGGASGNDILVIKADGTYGWLFLADNGPVSGAPGAAASAPIGSAPRGSYTNNSGRWRLEDDALLLVYQPAPALLKGLTDGEVVSAVQPSDQWPTDFSPSGSAFIARMSIAKVDESFLRLVSILTDRKGRETPGSPKFFRRAQTKQVEPQVAEDLPKEYQRIAEQACLNADESRSLVKWATELKNQPNSGRPELNLEVVDRGLAARAGKIDFADLFHLTADEAAGYRELNRLTDGFSAICVLADQGQLTPAELSALAKLKKYKAQIDATGMLVMRSIAGSGPAFVSTAMASDAGGNGEQAGGDAGASAPTTPSPAAVQLEMLYKLQTLIGELHSWLACTVFGG
jgi:hypothetical protein